nr:GntR family transcriptional regulator [uncultured bacterium]BAH90480.1 GntR family transcriptional regulator [uncultured bacterium]
MTAYVEWPIGLAGRQSMSEIASQSQTLKAVLGLRGLIVDGVLPPGSRVAEPLIVQEFGVSRTPARAALAQVAAEGLLEKRAGSGYAVASFTESDIFQAIEIRGILEGLAARYAAEGQASETILKQMDKCVTALDDVVDSLLENSDQSDYVEWNDRFHSLLLEASGSSMVATSLERIKTLPFATPNAFVKSMDLNRPAVQRVLLVAQEQHRSIVEAIRAGNGSRAQSLTLEHSFCAKRYLQLLGRFEKKIPWVA